VLSIEKQGFRDPQLHQLAMMLHDAHRVELPLQEGT
jgi:cation transport protein ChaC